MKMLTLRLRPLEPLLFRGAGEFDPSSRGVYSHAMSLHIPRPSTIAGALVAYFLHEALNVADICVDVDSWEELLKCYVYALDKLGVEAIRGPYICNTRRDIVYVPLMLGGKAVLVEYYQVSNYLLSGDEDLISSILDKPSYERLLKLKHVESELAQKYQLRLNEQWRVGIGLRDRLMEESTKTVRRGYIYTVVYSVYPRDVEVRFKVLIRDDSELTAGTRAPIIIGGEHRIAEMIIDSSRDEVDEALEKEKFKYALLLAPMPIRGKLSVRYIGRLSIIGLGFSAAKRKRKPIYSAILEGSIVRTTDSSNRQARRDDLLRHALYHLLGFDSEEEYMVFGRLGYSSFVPLG